MDYCKIGKFQAISLILIVIFNHLILNLPQNMYNITGSSILINIVWISLIMILFTLAIIKLFKPFSGQDLLDITEFLGGKKLKTVISIIFLIFYVAICGILLRDFLEKIRVVYYVQIPIWLLCILILSIGVIANKFGANSVSKLNLIIVFTLLISFPLLFATAIPYYSFETIYPILGNGIEETFLNGISNIYAFNGFSFLYFIMPLLKSNKDFRKVGIASIIVGAIYIFFAMMSLLFSFTFIIPTNGSPPLYLLLLSSKLGQFFQSPDSLFILTWILGIMSFISVTIMFCSIIFKKMCNIKEMYCLPYVFASLIFIATLIPINQLAVINFENTIYRYSVICLVFIAVPILLIFANIKKKHLKQ